ncbi:NUDIX hydrolase N-terminal domain-containing protein [Luteolibacter sp. LG18]|uniref:NUDIX hydrolase n=1 Tax=Luteolibacter sp. LG18 TaxID=2819286 RepID=UPI002B2D76DC|nr:putative ADP-ribose pyrophosphatase YjhB [Luteolibacter sp. LG18]
MTTPVSTPAPLDWIALSRELKSIAEAGLRYGENAYDRERYARILELAAAPIAAVAPEFAWPHEFGYATPKVDVRAVVFDGDRVLLVREASNGLWTLPGGWADLNLSPAENAAKEVKEEAGLDVAVEKLIACWDKDKQGHPKQPEHVYKLVFLCRKTGGELATSHETDAVEFFPLDQLPDLCPHRAARHYIDLARQHVATPGLPTAFD